MVHQFPEEISKNLWDDKFTFFWYNEKEIFHWTQRDFDVQARKMHDSGITYAMTFSVTHFRWSYLPWKQEILEALKKLCTACHKVGIKVIEHHSSHLNYQPQSEEEWNKLAGYFQLHESSFEGFGDIRGAFLADPVIDGVPFSSLFQIDGRTGQPAETGYNGHALCFNNPHYRKAYFSYLEEVARTGVDAILPDDVQYFGDGNACACPHCRRLFQEETGFELPPPEKWQEFGGHFEREDFIAWRRFRNRSTQRFQNDLTQLFIRLGISPRRTNYRSSLLGQDTTANTFTGSLDCWAHVFQENMFSTVLKLNWPLWACEAALQYSFGRRKNAPSMSLFYPDRYDQYYFSWALAESWGQLPFLCPEGGNMLSEDRRFNQFEQKYASLLRQSQKISDAAFLMSRETLDHTSESYPNTSNPLRALMQGAYFSGIGFDMVSEDEDLQAFLQHKIIFCCGIRRVLPELLEKLDQFAEKGGKVVIVRDFGTISRPDGLENFLKKENVIRIDSVSGNNMYLGLTVSRMYGRSKPLPAPANTRQALLTEEGPLVRSLLPEPPFAEAVPPGWVMTMFRPSRKKNTVVLHLIHVQDLLPPEGTPVSHQDEIKHFMPDAEKNPEPLKIILNYGNYSSARLYSPEFEGSREAELTRIGHQTTLTIPAHTAAGYLLAELSEKF